jgi:hypothetical protein
MDNVILDLESYVSVTPRKTWDMMGKPKLVSSTIQLRLDNQHKIISIGMLAGVCSTTQVFQQRMNTFSNHSHNQIKDQHTDVFTW